MTEGPVFFGFLGGGCLALLIGSTDVKTGKLCDGVKAGPVIEKENEFSGTETEAGFEERGACVLTAVDIG